MTYAAFSLLGLFAPFLGSWADRTGRHRDLLIWGTVGSGVLLLLFDAADVPLRIVLAAGAGLGVMATTTAGNVLAIQGFPEAEWDTRVALLQRYVSAGQVIGLVAAGLLARSHPGDGFVFAGVALLAAGALAFVSAPGRLPRASSDKPAPRPMMGGDAGVSGPHHRGHHFSWQELRAFLSVINRPLRRFLIVWLIAYPAMNGFATLFPRGDDATVRHGPDPAIECLCDRRCRQPAALRAGRRGDASPGRLANADGRVRRETWRCWACSPSSGLLHGGWVGWLVLVGFALIQFVWPLLAVAANSLSVRLAPTARGESVGLFNAATSLAAAVGSAAAGVIFGIAGFAALAAVAFVAVGVAVVLAALWPAKSES